MTDLERTLAEAAADLRSEGQRFALVGGLAVSARCEPRLTRDADIAVAVPDDAAAEDLVRALIGRGYEVTSTVEHERSGRLATVRLHKKHGHFESVLDLLFASSGIEPEIVDGAEELSILPGLVVRVASIGHLVATKLLARDDRHRPTDADDLAALAAVAGDEDWSVAQEAVELIEMRGYSRDRGLTEALAELRAHGPY